MTPSAPTPRQRPPDAVYKVINPVFKTVLRSPLHGVLSKRLIVLTFTGRKSGKRYSTPVGYALTDDGLVFTTQAPWSKNLRGAAPVTVQLRGETRKGVATVVDDIDGLLAGYRTMFQGAPELADIVGVRIGPDGEPNREDVAQARERGYVVVRVRLT